MWPNAIFFGIHQLRALACMLLYFWLYINKEPLEIEKEISSKKYAGFKIRDWAL